MRRKAAVKSSRTRHGSVLKNGQKNASVLVRPIRLADFEFIRDLSSTIEGYTVPPPYVLWMFRRFQRELCLIAEGPTREPLGYMLAMSAGVHSNEIFIWQLATTFKGQRLRTSSSLASHVRELVRKRGIRRITFTAVLDSAAMRSIASLAYEMFGRRQATGARLPRSISANEREFHLLP